MTTVADADFDRLLAVRGLKTVFQPVVRLADGDIVAYEALVRGPGGSRFETADSLLSEAYRTGRVVEFDWAARASACRAATEAELDPQVPVFLNIEPMALDTECPADLRADVERAYSTLQIVLEVTERSLDRDPRSLLDGVDRVRGSVAGVAVDDVGANAGTLSMMSILQPELIKLDLSVIHRGPTLATMKVVDSVYAESERTGATVLAEGVETARQAGLARSMGADLAQGRYFGDPAPLRSKAVRPLDDPLVLPPYASMAVRTPFDATTGRETSRGTVRLLGPLSRQVEVGGVDPAASAIFLALLPHPHFFGATELRRWSHLVERGVLAGVLGPGVPAHPGGGIRGAAVEAGDGLSGQWAVACLSPHTAGAMLARGVPGSASEYEFLVTHDRQRVIAAVRCLLRRLGHAEGRSPADVALT